MNVPNLFTTLRIVLIPVFGYLWWSGRHSQALWVFVIAGMTDLLDGFLARYLDQRTRLGSFLDPAADKLMLLVAFLVAAAVGAVPAWLAALVIGRDVILSLCAATLALLWRRRRGELIEWHPTRIGKYSAFLQLTTIGLALFARAAQLRALYPWIGALVLSTATLTVLSTVQYVAHALDILAEHRRTHVSEATKEPPS